MRYYILFFLTVIYFNAYAQLPEGFVYAKDIIPDLDVELRYYNNYNFVGRPIYGYDADKLIMTKKTALALKKVQKELQNKNLCIRVYDAYRPQRAVNHFVKWAKDIDDKVNKHIFYPEVKKENLFKEGYIASRSGHSRGSTLDLTIVDRNTGEPLDMGSPFDFFGEESWVYCEDITSEQKRNRQLLKNIMTKFGFRNYPKEWWHFTLRQEPFPGTYFDFPIK